VANGSVSIAAQNCLFNIFKTGDLARALSEVLRVLRLGGMFTTSDPVSPVALPDELAADEQLRARCIAGCLTIEQYLAALTDAGFGRVDVRARFPYRHLDPRDYPALKEAVMLESIEAAAFKVPDGPDGPAVFTGRTATYTGPGDSFDDPSGTHLRKGIPVEVSEAAAARLARQCSIQLTPPTWHAKGGGCC
jgi:hypothetical protein